MSSSSFSKGGGAGLIKFGGQKASNFRDSSNLSDVVVIDPDFWKKS